MAIYTTTIIYNIYEMNWEGCEIMKLTPWQKSITLHCFLSVSKTFSNKKDVGMVTFSLGVLASAHALRAACMTFELPEGCE